jgi:hypothetical protein
MKKLLIATLIAMSTTAFAEDGYYMDPMYQAEMMKYISAEVVKNGTTVTEHTTIFNEVMFGDDEVGYFETAEEYINAYDPAIRAVH